MSFINPNILPWLGLVAIPIIIYLINRRRFKRIIWAAMEFLLKAMKKNRRRLRLENLLLLIIRTLIVLLVVLAVARPQVKQEHLPGITGRQKKNWIIVIDNSFSMGYKVGPTSSLEKAKTDLKTKVDQHLGTGDKVFLMTMSDSPKLIYKAPLTIGGESDLRTLRTDIDLVELTHRTTDAYATLKMAAEVLDKFEEDAANPKEEKAILMATDCQASAWLRKGVLASKEYNDLFETLKRKKTSLWILDVGVEQPVNFAIIDLKTEQGSQNIGTRMPVLFSADLKNFSTVDMEVTLTFSVDDVPQMTRSVMLGGWQQLTESFTYEFQTTGGHTVSVSARSDPLAIDNTRSLALYVRDNLKILVVDGKPSPHPYEDEVIMIKAIFDAQHSVGTTPGMPLFDYEICTVNEFLETASGVGRKRLEDYDVLILANVGNLPTDVVSAIKGYVENGGGLLYFLGDMVETEAFNVAFFEDGKGLLPYRLRDVFPKDELGMNYYGVSIAAPEHPVVDIFDGYPEAIANPQVFRFFRVEEKAREGAMVLARLTQEQEKSPIIVEQRFGRGSSIFVLTTASTSWNNWGCYQFFIIFIHEAVAYLTTMGGTRLNIKVGEEFKKIFPQGAWVGDILITRPDGRTVNEKLKQEEGKERFMLLYSDTEVSGVYRMSFDKGERFEYFACNPDTTESNLTKVTESDFKTAFPTAKIKISSYQKAEGKDKAKKEDEPLTELWKFLVTAVLVLLGVEMVLAMVFGRRRSE
jgi:uncharacterized membrane protein